MTAWRPSRFGLALFSIAVSALAVRLLYAQQLDDVVGLSDAVWYRHVANALAHGHGFTIGTKPAGHSATTFTLVGPRVPTAFHPPLFPALLAIPAKLGVTSYAGLRVVGCVLGAGMAAVVGLVGRRVGGERLGLLAAALAAIYPPLVANESILMSESLYGLMIALTILTALWASEAPTWRRAAVLGAVIGLDALTRAEGLLLLVLLVPFVVRRVRPGASRRYLVALAAAAVVVAPWCVRNSLQFDRPLGISTGDGAVLAGANNEISYHGDRTGTWQFSALAVPASAGVDPHDDADIGEYQRGKGLDYLRAHDGRVPLVALARVLRTWGLFPLDPSTHAHQESFTSGRRLSVAWVTLAAGWAATALALGGALLLRRRGLLCAALLAPIALVTIDSAVFYGDVRFREAADISLVVLAAVALTHVYTLARGR